MKWRPASEKPDKLLETYYCKVYRDEIKQGWKKTVLITLDGVWNTDDTVIEWLDESPSGANVLVEALKKIRGIIPEGDDYDPGQFVFDVEYIVGKALAQYNAATPQTPIDTEPEGIENLWNDFAIEYERLQRMEENDWEWNRKILMDQYHITRK